MVDTGWGCVQGWFVYCGSNSEQCLGGYDFACSNTTRGSRCAQCADDHYKLGGTCYSCPGGMLNWLLSIGATGCVVMFFLTLNALTAGAFDSIDIALLYLQVLSTIQGFSTTWSHELLDTVAQYVSIINFDLDFVTPACVFGVWEYEAHFMMTMMQMPAVVLICVAVRTYKSVRFNKRKDSRGGASLSHEEVEALQETTDMLIARLFSFAVVVYNNLVIVSFQPFACEAVPGQKVRGAPLDGSPIHLCGLTPSHVLPNRPALESIDGFGDARLSAGVPVCCHLCLTRLVSYGSVSIG